MPFCASERYAREGGLNELGLDETFPDIRRKRLEAPLSLTLYCVMSSLHRAEAVFLLQQGQHRVSVRIPGMEEESPFLPK